jgi:hypothetical protein
MSPKKRCPNGTRKHTCCKSPKKAPKKSPKKAAKKSPKKAIKRSPKKAAKRERYLPTLQGDWRAATSYIKGDIVGHGNKI